MGTCLLLSELVALRILGGLFLWRTFGTTTQARRSLCVSLTATIEPPLTGI